MSSLVRSGAGREQLELLVACEQHVGKVCIAELEVPLVVELHECRGVRVLVLVNNKQSVLADFLSFAEFSFIKKLFLEI